MAEYDNRGRGALFKNTDKTEEKHPDYRGNITTDDGTEYWLSAWLKKSKAGMTYMSLTIKPKDDGAAQSKKSAGGAARSQGFDDEIPFAPEFR